jgi:hypothetical protein
VRDISTKPCPSFEDVIGQSLPNLERLAQAGGSNPHKSLLSCMLEGILPTVVSPKQPGVIDYCWFLDRDISVSSNRLLCGWDICQGSTVITYLLTLFVSPTNWLMTNLSNSVRSKNFRFSSNESRPVKPHAVSFALCCCFRFSQFRKFREHCSTIVSYYFREIVTLCLYT